MREERKGARGTCRQEREKLNKRTREREGEREEKIKKGEKCMHG